LAVQSLAQKYFCFRKSEIMPMLRPSRLDARGVTRRHETRGGLRWTRDAARRAAKLADEEGVWFWHPWAGAKCADDDPRMTVTNRSRTPGRSRRKTLTPSRGEGRSLRLNL
jgi:hypothetical protein